MYLYNYKYYFILIFILMSPVVLGQQVDHKLKEIEIKADSRSFYIDDNRKEELDTLLSGNISLLNLGDALSTSSGLLISSYGSRGSLSGIKIRGTGNIHTSFNWNGIPLNSITTGSMDLSLVPVGFMQDVILTKGASGVMAGNSTFGGSVILDNKPDWRKKYDASIQTEVGSFGYKAIMPSFLISGNRVQYRLSTQILSSVNDFPFRDTYKAGSPEERQDNDSLNQIGIIQNLFIRLGGNINIDAGLWIQHKDKDIPPVMGSYSFSPANQEDKSVKTYLKISKIFSTSRLFIQGAYAEDSLHYIKWETPPSDRTLIDSRIYTRSFFTRAEWRCFVGRRLNFDIGVHSEHLKAFVGNYGSEKAETRLSLISAARYLYGGWVVNAGLRKEFNLYNPPKPLASLGLSWKSGDIGNMFRANISNKFRIPTFNERYWQPGGNPDLKPESGWGGELAWKYRSDLPSGLNFEFEPVLFYQKIKDWIIWVPSAENWHPENREMMISKGAEINAKAYLIFQDWIFTASQKYSYTSARQGEHIKENEFTDVIYIPRHQSLSGFGIQKGKFRIAFAYQFMSRRFTSTDNNPVHSLDPVHLVNWNASWSLGRKQMLADIYIRINNLLNYQYQFIRSYATPGISWTAGLKVNFQKLKPNEKI